MIKNKLYWLPLIALFIVGIVWLASQNHGYVLIVSHPYRIQVSLNFLLIFLALSFLGLHYSLRLVRFLLKLPTNRRSKKELMHLKAANMALLDGINALADSDFEKAKVAAELAQKFTQNTALEKLIKMLVTEKTNKN